MRILTINKQTGIQRFIATRVTSETNAKMVKEVEDFSDTDEQSLRQSRHNSRQAAACRICDPLTVQESAVMRLLARGLRYKEIADSLGLSYAKVHKLQHKIYVKLQASNAAEAVARWAGLHPG